MAQGTAPHRVAPGVWATRDGRRLTRAGSAYWEHHHQQGLVTADGHLTHPALTHPTRVLAPKAPPPPRGQPTITPGQWKRTPPREKMATQVTVPYKGKKYNVPIGFGGASSVSQQMKAAEAARQRAIRAARPVPQATGLTPGLKKPPFATFLQASKGNREAVRAIQIWDERQKAVEQGKLERDKQIEANLFGAAVPTIHAADRYNPIMSAVIEGFDPIANAKAAALALRHGDVPNAALYGASILPFGPGGGFLRGGLAGARAARTARQAGTVAKAVGKATERALIPERAAMIAGLGEKGIPEAQIKSSIAWYDNQAARHPGGPEEWWRTRVGPGGKTPAEVAAQGGTILHQAAPEPAPHIPHPETPEAAALRATHLPDERAVFDGVDMSVFREHDIGGFLKKIPEYLKRGAPYRYWYENSGKAILRYAGGDKELAARVAQLVAVYSASRKPTENINLAMQALRQWDNNGVIRNVATAPQDVKANAIMRGEQWEGRKTNRFYANMLKWIDEPRYLKEFPGGEVTNDIWMARLFGLKSDVPTPREYDAMTKITQNIADQLGWSPEEIQAALWVPAKADAGRTVTGKGGKKIRAALADDEAGIDFARALDQESSQMTVEAAPGPRSSPELHAAYQELAPEAKQSYYREKMDAVKQFLGEVGAFADISAEGIGIWKNLTNPAFTITFPLGGARAVLKTGKKATVSTTSSEGKKFMTAVMSHVGEALNQDAMAWFRPFYRRDPITQQNGARLTLSRPLTEEETLRFSQGLKAQFGGDVPIPPAEGNDLYVLNFTGTTNRKFHEALEQVLEDALVGGDEIKAHSIPFRFDGDLKTRSRYAPQARNLDTGRGFAGRSDVQQAARRLHATSRGIDERYLGAAERTGDELAPGRVLHQRDPASSLPRGATEFLKDGTRVHFFEGADVSTVMHELLHVSVYDLRGRHLNTLADEFAGGKALAHWTDAEHEAVAEAFEQWLRTGEITNEKLKGPFQAIKDWMNKIVGRAKSAGMVVPKDVEDAFNYMFREPLGTSLEEQVVGAAKRAKTEVYPVQESKRSVERAKRFEASEAAREEAGGGFAGQHAALEQLKGEYWKEPFNDLTHLDENDMEYLIDAVGGAKKLRGIQKTSLIEALKAANRGEVFRPSDADLVFKAFGPAKGMGKGRTRTQRALDLLTQIVNIPRSFMSSFDVSGILRQGLMTAVMHPVMTAKLTPSMMRYLFSEQYYLERMARYRQDPRYHLLTEEGGLELTDTGHEFGSEEAYQSHIAETLTGGKYGPIRASGRAYTGLLNDLRWGSATNMYDLAHEANMLTGEELQRIGKVSNWATGRGTLGSHEQSAQLMNLFLFSPRLLASRLQTFNPWFYKSLDPEQRLLFVRWSHRTPAQKQALKATSRLLLAGGSILGLAKLAGADIELDPRSSDFAKIKVGDTRVDIWGGHQSIVRTFFQALSGQRIITSTGELRDTNNLDPIFRFFEGKASPPMSLAFDYHRGKTFTGDPFYWGDPRKVPWDPKSAWNPHSAIGSRVSPLGVQDTWEAYQQADDAAVAALIFALSFVGLSTQTYPADESGGGSSGGGRDWGLPTGAGAGAGARTDWGVDTGTGAAGGRTDWGTP